MSAADSLPMLLRSLGLRTVLREQSAAMGRARSENWSYRRFLQRQKQTSDAAAGSSGW